MQVRGKRFTVLGAGRSGLAAARLLRKKRGHVFLSDTADAASNSAIIRDLEEIGVGSEFGENTHRVLEADTIVISPGVPLNSPIVELARQQGIQIVSEIELGYLYCDAPIIAITGTNGKTTTTTLTGELLRLGGWQPILAGNIGKAFCDVVDDAKGEKAVVVLEVSSFQLDTIETFRPKISMLLNITPDHLDRYPNYEAYIQSKFRIVENQKGQDIFIYNFDDEVVRSFAETVNVKTLPFSITSTMKEGAWLADGALILKAGRSRESVLPANEIGIPGPHNLMNAMAAALAVRSIGVQPEYIAVGLREFKGVEHRIEFVRTLKGVDYYNDSKATNVDSLHYALQSFERPIVLILGGKDKGNDYHTVRELVQKHVKAIVAVGQGAEKIAAQLGAVVPVEQAGYSMPQAVMSAARLAEKGDIVLLSPACASFDMFDNYEHRGRVFKEIVHSLTIEGDESQANR